MNFRDGGSVLLKAWCTNSNPKSNDVLTFVGPMADVKSICTIWQYVCWCSGHFMTSIVLFSPYFAPRVEQDDNDDIEVVAPAWPQVKQQEQQEQQALYGILGPCGGHGNDKQCTLKFLFWSLSNVFHLSSENSYFGQLEKVRFSLIFSTSRDGSPWFLNVREQ